MDYPLFNLTLNVDITAFLKRIKDDQESFFYAFLFLTTKAMNEVEAFRLRIREEEVVLHDAIHPSFTYLTDEDTFAFTEVKFVDDFARFKAAALHAAAESAKETNLSDEVGRDDFIFVSSLPWLSFTSITHPIHLDKKEQSVPRLTWGKYFQNGDKTFIPLSIQVNHALVDGIHIAQFVGLLEALLAKW
jgi:chloramphenicol O-acetyltransferase type A